MVTTKRKVEVFMAGGPICDTTVEAVTSLVCPRATCGSTGGLRDERMPGKGETVWNHCSPGRCYQRCAVGLLQTRADHGRSFEGSRYRTGVTVRANIGEE